MRSIDIANMLIEGYGNSLALTNLKLNKLVYVAQVESIRSGQGPLFEDRIEAWERGPVEPMAYHTFKGYGRSLINQPSEPAPQSQRAREIVCRIASTYGKLSAFDLVTVSHRDGGAWKSVYEPGCDREITLQDIELSDDMGGFESIGETFSQKVDSVVASLPNALSLLQNS